MEKFWKIGVRLRIKYLFILFFYIPFLSAQEAYKTDESSVQRYRKTALDCLKSFYGPLSEINLQEDDDLPDFVEIIMASVHEEAYFFPTPGPSIKNKQPQTCKMFALHFLSELKLISPSAKFRIELSDFVFQPLFLTEDRRKLTLEIFYQVNLYGNETLQYIQQANAVVLFPSFKNTWLAKLKQVNNISEKETRMVEWGNTEEEALSYLNHLRLRNYKDTVIQTNTYIYKGGVNTAKQWHGVGEIRWISETHKGHYYYGELKNGYRAGKGIYKWPNGNIYIGDWLNNKRTGKGTLKWANGNEYNGDWIDSKQTGKGTLKWANGDEYKGDWKEGERTGKGTLKWTSGNEYSGDFYKDKMHGKGTYKFKSGNSYTGDFVDGDFHGKGTFKWSNGNEYTGDFVNDKRTGNGTLKKKDGTVQSGTFKDGVFMGSEK